MSVLLLLSLIMRGYAGGGLSVWRFNACGGGGREDGGGVQE